MWFKALVSAACVCVIAVSGHYGYSVYQQHIETQRRAVWAAELEARAALEAAKERAEEKQAREAARDARKKELQARREAKKALEQQKQADRDRAAEALKDAVVNY